ncbi:MAG: Methyltransferase type 12 [Microgenomates group bacterium GW2011_GWA1_48_10]|nr:MAG: Methyltransferase type 12 [Microgenomates group bacterium GW2011_GWA1_48_10]
MNKTCRFCHQKTLKLLYGPTNQDKTKTGHQFACTNCGYGVHGPIVKCQNCGMIYVDEPISQKEISEFYQISEDPVYLAEQKAREKTFKLYLAKLEKVIHRKGKLLDVGTNTGLFVKVARDNSWQATGLEPNAQAVQYAKDKFGLTLIAKPFETNTFPKESFDVITMWDVIEHFTDPVSEITKVYRTLKKGGVFAFSTVDPESLTAKIRGSKWPWYMEMHRVLLSRPVIERYLRQSGFKTVFFRSHWRFFSLGYAATRWETISPTLARILTSAVKIMHLQKVLVPFYANDLYDCYAFK